MVITRFFLKCKERGDSKMLLFYNHLLQIFFIYLMKYKENIEKPIKLTYLAVKLCVCLYVMTVNTYKHNLTFAKQNPV